MLQTVSVLLDPQAGDLNDVPGPESNTSMVASNLVDGFLLDPTLAASARLSALQRPVLTLRVLDLLRDHGMCIVPLIGFEHRVSRMFELAVDLTANGGRKLFKHHRGNMNSNHRWAPSDYVQW